MTHLPGTTYTVMVQIRNRFGISDAVFVSVTTLLEPIKLLAETKVKDEAEGPESLAMILGALVTILLLVSVILLVSFSYRRWKLNVYSEQSSLPESDV